MALFLVPSIPIQLSMGFAGFDSPASWPTEEQERERRSGQEWLKSIRDYCKWRAGMPWRRSSDRFNPNRLWYLNGVRCVQDVMYAPAESLQLVLPCIDGVACITELERGLAALDRSILVDRLMAASPLFTDRRRLSFLPKMKLARMLARALDEQDAQQERKRA